MAKNDKKEETKAVTASDAAGLPAEVPQGYWGAPEQPSSKEMLIPKFLMCQGQSKLVLDGIRKAGDIANSVTGQQFGGPDKAVEFIPILKLPSIWVVNDIVYDQKTGKSSREYRETIPVTAKNENDPWTEMDDKQRVVLERDYTIQFMVMVVDDINGFPYVMALRRTSIRAGKKIANHFQLCQKDKVAPAKYALKFQCKREMKDQQPYYVAELLAERRETTAAEMKAAYDWYVTFQHKKDEFKIDDSDERETTAGPASGTVDAAGTEKNAQY